MLAITLLPIMDLTCHNRASPTSNPKQLQPHRRYPRVFISSKQIDLGTVTALQTISGCITIKNDGLVTLYLDRLPTGCRAPTPYFDWEITSDYHSIAPGESREISVFVPALGSGGPHEAAFEIRSDDPRNARIPIAFRYSYPIDENT